MDFIYLIIMASSNARMRIPDLAEFVRKINSLPMAEKIFRGIWHDVAAVGDELVGMCVGISPLVLIFVTTTCEKSPLNDLQ